MTPEGNRLDQTGLVGGGRCDLDASRHSCNPPAMEPHLAALGATTSEILLFLRNGMAAGARGVLVTLTALEGSSSRAIGTHMAVLEDGSFAGSFSAGCIEAGIVAEALDVLREGRSRTVRFGSGSPYIDLKLPCGGGIDLHFLPNPAIETVSKAVATLESRHAVSLALGTDGLSFDADGTRRTGWDGPTFRARHAPPLRMIVAGHGAEVVATLRLAAGFGAIAELLSPDAALVRSSAERGVKAQILTSITAPPEFTADPWAAILLLFHDHEWEGMLLEHAVTSPAFWIGAMGSPRTHEARLSALAERGMGAEKRARIHGPIGLLPSSRDPATLALSALAEIVGAYHRVTA